MDEVTGKTIRKCWWKSTIIKKPVDQPQDLVNQQDQVLATELQAQIAQLPGLADPLTVNEFVQLESEVVEDQVEDGDEGQVFQDLVEQYGAGDEDMFEPEEDAAVDDEDRDISLLEAAQALETLRLFTLRREDGSESLLQELDQADRQFQAMAIKQRTQRTIQSFWKNK